MTITGEQKPLLLKKQSGSVRFSEMSESLRESSIAPLSGTKPGKRPNLLQTASTVSIVFQRLTKSERAEALQKEGVGRAAFLIRDAVLNEASPAAGSYDPYANPAAELRNLIALISRRLLGHTALKRFQSAVLWMLVMLTFIEPPIWCQSYDPATSDQSCVHLLSLQGIAAGEDETSDPVLYYPNSKAMLLTTYRSHIVEGVCLGLVGFFVLLHLGRDGMRLDHYFRVGQSRVVRLIELASFVGLMTGLFIDYRVFQPYLRGILLACHQPTVIRDVRVLWHMLPEIFNVLALLAVFITFYAWFGCVMFVDTQEGDEHFPNLIEGWWTLWICVTTANYPDVMMPAYNLNRWTALYFVSFMILSFFFLMNVITSSVLNEYDGAIEKRKTEKVDMAKKNLTEAYKALDPKDQGYIDRDTVMAIFFVLNEDFPEIRTISDDDTKLLFAVLDKDGTSTISQEEFLEFGNVLLLEFVRQDSYASIVERRFPKIYQSQWYKKFEEVLKSDQFELFIDAVLSVNAIVIFIQTYPELSSGTVHIDPKYWDGSIDTVWELMETIFTVIYALEAILKITVLSWKKYIESQRNVFDFTITVLAVVSSIIVYYPNEFSDSRIIRMIVMARVMRLVRLLTAVKRFQLLGRISAEILPDAVPVIILLFLMMYFFAAIGVHLYGGLITRDPSNRLSWLLLNTDFSENEYWANNFNDMISAMNVLFNLLVINNWTECEVGFEATTEEKWCRFFFLFFHICGVILVNNLVTAFVINSFMNQLAIIREKDDVEQIGDEAELYRGEAHFDAAMVTGTRTSLRGGYIARIRHTHSGEEGGHYQERLKHLFSKSSSTGDEK